MSSNLNRIIIKNLVNRHELNGQGGIVKAWDISRQRFLVCVSSTNENVFVKAMNLEHVNLPRFPIGEAVFLNVGRWWAPGRVVAHFYTEDHFPPKVGPIVPYRIEMDGGGFKYAPSDIDRCICKRITVFSELLQYLKENPHLLYDLSFMESYFDSGLLDFRGKKDSYSEDETEEVEVKKQQLFEVFDTEGSSEELLQGSSDDLMSSYTPCKTPS